MVRGVRGAITVGSNTAEAIREASRRVLTTIVDENDIELDQIASVIFSATKDLDVETPAFGAREMGWTAIPLFCTQEMEVPEGLARCIRVLIHVNTDKPQDEIRHVYLDGAVVLRPDIAEALDLDGLAANGVYEFVFVLSHLNIYGATGAPVRPLALA